MSGLRRMTGSEARSNSSISELISKLEHLNDVIYGYIQIEYALVGSVDDNLHKHESKL